MTPWRDSFGELATALTEVQVESGGYKQVINWVNQHGLQKARLFFIGNGGSAAIASHMAIDWSKNGKFATFGPGDASYMTCVSNDLGFENVYAMQIARHGQLGDVLFAISSSGMSENILKAVDTALDKRMNVVSLSGFSPSNRLREMGAINFYVPSDKYGTVEVAHLAILHSILDEVMVKS